MKRKRKYNKDSKPNAPKTTTPKQSNNRTMTIDAFSNVLARLGAGTPNLEEVQKVTWDTVIPTT